MAKTHPHTAPRATTARHAILPMGLILSFILSACSFAPLSPPPTPTLAEPVILHVYTFRQPPISQVLDIVVKAFEAKHPEVQVSIDAISDDPAKELATKAASQNMPDVVWTVDALTPSLADAGLLLDMREIANVDQGFKQDDINPGALSLGNVAATPGLYMIPVVMENVQMFYNKTLFKDSGAPLPGADWTWDDLIAACKQIQDAHTDVTCLDYSYYNVLDAGWWAYLVPWMRGYGGDVLSADGQKSTFSSPESLAGIQAYVDLWRKHKIALPPGQQTDRGSCFMAAKCAVTFSISGGISFLQERIGKEFEWDVQRMPAHPRGRYTGTLTYGYGISKLAKHRDLAWEFIKMLVNPDVQRTIAQNRAGLPVLKSLASDPTVIGSGPPANMQVFYQAGDMLIYPHAYPTACGNLYIGMVQSLLSDAMHKVINGSDVATTFKQVDVTIQGCLNSAK